MEQLTIIKPRKKLSLDFLPEIWRYRELLYFFAWREFKIRYKQTLIGVVWVVFQPLFSMIVFSVFFGKLARISSDNIPYPIFVYAGLLFWQFFSASLTEISNCLVDNKDIITKIYFPRLILPMSIVLVRLIDFAMAALVLIVLMAYYGYLTYWSGLLILPLLCLITGMAALGLGAFLMSFNAKYRDIKQVMPFFIQMIFFVTPVIYPASLTGVYSWFLAVNPLTGVVKAARSALFHDFAMNWPQLFISAMACLIILIMGILYFKKAEEDLVDVV